MIWHLAFPASVIGYVVLKARSNRSEKDQMSAKAAIVGSMALQVGLVFALTAAIIGSDADLPRLLLNKTTFAPLAVYTGWLTALVCVIALLLLWIRQSSVLDRWVMIAVFATLLETSMLAFLEGRFTFGWYSVRVFGFTASATVLIALLTETTRLYAKLAVTTRALERDRDTKITTAQAITAAIAHEIRQPLTGIVASGGAAIRFLHQTPPDLARAQDALQRVVGTSHRVSDIFEGIRELFGNGHRRRRPLDLDRIVLDVLRTMQDEAKAHLIDIRTELATGLPPVSGDASQLSEVVTNLVQNAFDAMRGNVGRTRVLRVMTQLHDGCEISVTVEDSGPGIASERLGEIFGAFFTTKAQGTGLGLAICRMIVEHHGGRLTVSSDGVNGAAFQFVLPVETAGAVEESEELRTVESVSIQAA